MKHPKLIVIAGPTASGKTSLGVDLALKFNGEIISELGTKVDPLRDRVEVRNKIVRPAHKGIILFHKPKNVISTLEDPQGRPSIKDYLTKHHQSYFPVGRLDFESTGLMILTNDGDLADRLLHPRFGLARIYEAKVSGVVSAKTVDKLSRGVFLEDGQAKAKVEVISTAEDSSWLSIQVSEGRNRLIRRMMDKVHHPVNKLQRVIHGPFKLGRLKPGQMRKLTEKEYAYYRDRIMNYIPGQVPAGKTEFKDTKPAHRETETYQDEEFDLQED